MTRCFFTMFLFKRSRIPQILVVLHVSANRPSYERICVGKIFDFPAHRSANAVRAGHARLNSNAERLLNLPAFPNAVVLLARNFIAAHEASPRTAALFATQQRWLLCHAALAFHFQAAQDGRMGVTRRGFGNLALQQGIASRNTAYAFFDEALKYDIIRPVSGDGSVEPVVPAPLTMSLLAHWYSVHFKALDLLCGGDRTGRFLAEPESMLTILEPLAARELLSSPEIRSPGPLYTIFTWADAGGLLMDRLVAGIDLEALTTQPRLLTDVNTISSLAHSFGLSRAHTSRKFSAAESIGGLGWSGRRGHSPIWVSRGFYEEYARAHARKLLILDDAFEEAVTALSQAKKSAVANDA